MEDGAILKPLWWYETKRRGKNTLGGKVQVDSGRGIEDNGNSGAGKKIVCLQGRQFGKGVVFEDRQGVGKVQKELMEIKKVQPYVPSGEKTSGKPGPWKPNGFIKETGQKGRSQPAIK